VDAQAGLHVLQPAHEQAAAHRGEVREHGGTFGDDLLPALAPGVSPLGGHHAEVGRVPVREEVDAVASDARAELGVEVVDHGDEGALLRQVEDVHLDLAGRRSVVDLDEHVPAVVRAGDADDLLRTVALPEDLLVGGGVRAHRVAEDSRTLLGLPGVVERGLVGVERGPLVARPGKHVGQGLPRVDVHRLEGDLVLAAVPHAVDEEAAVDGQVHEADRHGVIGAEAVGVEQDLVPRRAPLAHVEDEEVLVGAPLREEVPPAPGEGNGDRVDLDELGEPVLDPVPPRQRLQDGVGVGVLRVDPRPGGGGGLVLQPAIGVGDLHPVEGLDDRILAAGGRLRRLRGSRDERGGERRRESGGEGTLHGGSGHGRAP
jgi:hypothetical protein